MDRALSCPVCADVIGVYEPVIAFSGAATRRTSLAREPNLASSDEMLVHYACARELEASTATADAPA